MENIAAASDGEENAGKMAAMESGRDTGTADSSGGPNVMEQWVRCRDEKRSG